MSGYWAWNIVKAMDTTTSISLVVRFPFIQRRVSSSQPPFNPLMAHKTSA